MTTAPQSDNLLRAEADIAAEDARRKKAERMKHVGVPLTLPAKPIAMQVKDDDLWTAEAGGVLRRTLLETGKTVQIYKGHTGPVTCFVFFGHCLISGSWDKTIRVWDTKTRALLSTTIAHRDFLKTLLVIPSLQLLASGSSDKTIRFWDLSDPNWHTTPLRPLGSIAAHTRPVESLAADECAFACTRLFSADSMGALKVWRLERRYGPSASCRGVHETDIEAHTTGINDMWHARGLLWTASTDKTVQVHAYPRPLRPLGKSPVMHHERPVRCILPLPATELAYNYLFTGSGDAIRAYDVSTIEEPELLGELDAHAHDVTSLAYWVRRRVLPGPPAQTRLELWIISGSLDGTIRKWSLSQLVQPDRRPGTTPSPPVPVVPPKVELTPDELRELEDLMDSEDSSSSGSEHEGSPVPEPEPQPTPQTTPPSTSPKVRAGEPAPAAALAAVKRAVAV